MSNLLKTHLRGHQKYMTEDWKPPCVVCGARVSNNHALSRGADLHPISDNNQVIIPNVDRLLTSPDVLPHPDMPLGDAAELKRWVQDNQEWTSPQRTKERLISESPFHVRGIGKATLFRLLCAKCDADLFGPIDRDVDVANRDHLYRLRLRSAMFEWYAWENGARFFDQVGEYEKSHGGEYMPGYNIDAADRKRHCAAMWKSMVEDMLRNKTKHIKRVTCKFFPLCMPPVCSIYSSFTVRPPRRHITNFLTVFATSRIGGILLICQDGSYKDDLHVPIAVPGIKPLLDADTVRPVQIKHFVSRHMLENSWNLAINPTYWDSLGESAKMTIQLYSSICRFEYPIRQHYMSLIEDFSNLERVIESSHI